LIIKTLELFKETPDKLNIKRLNSKNLYFFSSFDNFSNSHVVPIIELLVKYYDLNSIAKVDKDIAGRLHHVNNKKLNDLLVAKNYNELFEFMGNLNKEDFNILTDFGSMNSSKKKYINYITI